MKGTMEERMQQLQRKIRLQLKTNYPIADRRLIIYCMLGSPVHPLCLSGISCSIQ